MLIVFNCANFTSTTGLALPPKPVLTRWGTWLEAAVFYAGNFAKVAEFIALLPQTTEKIKAVKALIARDDFKHQMISVFNYNPLPSFITKLEKHGLTMTQQIEILNEFKAQLSGSTFEKLKKCVDKNPDLKSILLNDGVDFNVKMRYAPLVSVDVERSFSMFKAFFRANRQSFLEDNIEMHLVIICNPDL